MHVLAQIDTCSQYYYTYTCTILIFTGNRELKENNYVARRPLMQTPVQDTYEAYIVIDNQYVNS